MKRVAEVLEVARSNLAIQARPAREDRRRGRPPLPEDDLLAEIETVIAGLPTYGYRRVHAVIRRRHETDGRPPVNVKRVWRLMKAHGLLLQRHTGAGEERRHDGRVAVATADTRWCSDGFEIGCENGERVRIAFTLDCCDREVPAWVATTGGIAGSDIRDLMALSVEARFGLVNRLPAEIEWLSDNGSPYTADDTRRFACEIGLVPRTTPIESPQSNGMAEAFVKTFKRDYAAVNPKPDALSVLRRLDEWFTHYNEFHPHKALGYRSPREFRRATDAVGARRRPHGNNQTDDGAGSRPKAAPCAEARSACLDADTPSGQ